MKSQKSPHENKFAAGQPPVKNQKSEDYKERYLRALADYQNLEKRVAKEKEEFLRYANHNLIKKLLPILNNLRKAQEQGKDEGVKLIYKQLWQVLESEGAKKIEVRGKKFDPQIMECLEVVEGKKEGEVAEELRRGYLLKDKLFLPAQVKVFKRKIEKKKEELAKKELEKGDYM